VPSLPRCRRKFIKEKKAKGISAKIYGDFKMKNKNSIRFTKLGYQFINAAKRDIDDELTMQQLAETAVRNNTDYLHDNLRGIGDMLKLCNWFSDINGVDITSIDRDIPTKAGSGDLDMQVQIELDPEKDEAIIEIEELTELTRSQAVRLCIFRELYMSSRDISLFEPPTNDIVTDVWYPAKKVIESRFRRIIFDLQTQVVDQEQIVKDKIRRDKNKSDLFGGFYGDHFYPSEGYHRMLDDDQGYEVLNCIESI
jgi:hypothetical protein